MVLVPGSRPCCSEWSQPRFICSVNRLKSSGLAVVRLAAVVEFPAEYAEPVVGIRRSALRLTGIPARIGGGGGKANESRIDDDGTMNLDCMNGGAETGIIGCSWKGYTGTE